MILVTKVLTRGFIPKILPWKTSIGLKINIFKVVVIPIKRPRCLTCGKQHGGKCLARMDGYYSCVHKVHKMRDCPNFKSMGKDVNQASLDPNAPKNNISYEMGARKDN